MVDGDVGPFILARSVALPFLDKSKRFGFGSSEGGGENRNRSSLRFDAEPFTVLMSISSSSSAGAKVDSCCLRISAEGVRIGLATGMSTSVSQTQTLVRLVNSRGP